MFWLRNARQGPRHAEKPGFAATTQRWAATHDRAFGLVVLMFPFWLVGQVARDDAWLTGMCFYIPSPFLAGAYLGFGLDYALKRRFRRSLVALALSVLPLGFVMLVENQFLRPSTPAQARAVRLVHWNVGGKLRPDGEQRVLRAEQADVYVLSEMGDGALVRDFRETLGPSYQATVFGNLAVVAKGEVRPRGWLLNRAGARVHSVAWEHEGRSALLFVVDLPANVLVARAPLLEAVNAFIERDQPDLILGDFNAPRRSRALARLPDGYQHAYDTVGRGWGYTWPVPLAMCALDQCIFSSRVVPVQYRLVSTMQSDHRYQIFDFLSGP